MTSKVGHYAYRKRKHFMNSQFIHVECYSLVPGKNKSGGHGVQSIIDEAQRREGNCPHVESPQLPKFLHGDSRTDVVAIARRWVTTAKDRSGRNLRKDGLCLLAGVVSVPDELKDWEAFKADTVKSLREKYGERLRSVIEHTDEPFRHMHFYVIPMPGEQFDDFHEGRQAAYLEKKDGKKKGAQNRAFIKAMRSFQDWFFDTVAIKHGLARFGARRARYSRAELEARKADMRLIKEAHEQATAKLRLAEEELAYKRREIEALAAAKYLQARQKGYEIGRIEGEREANRMLVEQKRLNRDLQSRVAYLEKRSLELQEVHADNPNRSPRGPSI
jgi:hypothetical protein